MSLNNHSNKVPPPVGPDNVSWPDIRTRSQLLKAIEILLSGDKVYPAQGNKIGEILKSLGAIDDKALEGVGKRHLIKRAKDKPTGELLVYLGIIEPEVLTRALCIQAGVLMVDVAAIELPYDVLKFISNDIAHEKQAIPVAVYKGTLYLAVADPLNFPDQQFFSFTTKLVIKPVFAPKNKIREFIDTKWDDAGAEVWAG